MVFTPLLMSLAAAPWWGAGGTGGPACASLERAGEEGSSSSSRPTGSATPRKRSSTSLPIAAPIAAKGEPAARALAQEDAGRVPPRGGPVRRRLAGPRFGRRSSSTLAKPGSSRTTRSGRPPSQGQHGLSPDLPGWPRRDPRGELGRARQPRRQRALLRAWRNRGRASGGNSPSSTRTASAWTKNTPCCRASNRPGTATRSSWRRGRTTSIEPGAAPIGCPAEARSTSSPRRTGWSMSSRSGSSCATWSGRPVPCRFRPRSCRP